MARLIGTKQSDISNQLIKTSIYALIMNGLAVWSYKKQAKNTSFLFLEFPIHFQLQFCIFVFRIILKNKYD